MEFVAWAGRVMHVVASMVWIGGKIGGRFVGFAWMCAWTMLVTGVILMLLDPRFVWFRYDTRWSVFLGLKQLIFVLLVFYAFGIARLLERLGGADNETGILILHRLRQFRTISILLGLCAAVLAVSM